MERMKKEKKKKGNTMGEEVRKRPHSQLIGTGLLTIDNRVPRWSFVFFFLQPFYIVFQFSFSALGSLAALRLLPIYYVLNDFSLKVLFKKIVEGIGGSEIKRDLNILTKKGEEEEGEMDFLSCFQFLIFQEKLSSSVKSFQVPE